MRVHFPRHSLQKSSKPKKWNALNGHAFGQCDFGGEGGQNYTP